ncbi:unnamed protein product, partial [Mesorhabditis belari]|uniref:Uncharacterized protein n=1 Tax=Mesorhabditis belari TaxID=2138241 RepID=A0AAF3EGM3_9BILA
MDCRKRHLRGNLTKDADCSFSIWCSGRDTSQVKLVSLQAARDGALLVTGQGISTFRYEEPVVTPYLYPVYRQRRSFSGTIGHGPLRSLNGAELLEGVREDSITGKHQSFMRVTAKHSNQDRTPLQLAAELDVRKLQSTTNMFLLVVRGSPIAPHESQFTVSKDENLNQRRRIYLDGHDGESETLVFKVYNHGVGVRMQPHEIVDADDAIRDANWIIAPREWKTFNKGQFQQYEVKVKFPRNRVPNYTYVYTSIAGNKSRTVRDRTDVRAQGQAASARASPFTT